MSKKAIEKAAAVEAAAVANAAVEAAAAAAAAVEEQARQQAAVEEVVTVETFASLGDKAGQEINTDLTRWVQFRADFKILAKNWTRLKSGAYDLKSDLAVAARLEFMGNGVGSGALAALTKGNERDRVIVENEIDKTIKAAAAIAMTSSDLGKLLDGDEKNAIRAIRDTVQNTAGRAWLRLAEIEVKPAGAPRAGNKTLLEALLDSPKANKGKLNTARKEKASNLTQDQYRDLMSFVAMVVHGQFAASVTLPHGVVTFTTTAAAE